MSDNSEKPVKDEEKEYVLFELSDGGTEVADGPVSKSRAREIEQAIHNHVMNGRYSGYDVPNNAVWVTRVLESEYEEDE